MQIECAECGEMHPATATFDCRACGGSLVPEYHSPLESDRIAAGETLFEKYGNRLPSSGSVAGVEGDTPLLRADDLAAELGVEATVYLKDERRNPTNSFKDRAFAPTISLAAEADADAVLTASSGNAATACAHYAARAGLDCFLLVEEVTPAGKLLEPRAYGADAVRIPDLFAGSERAFGEFLGAVGERLGAYVAFAYNPFNPIPLEGIKTISYEVAGALDWTVPDVQISATGGGDNLAAQHRGYVELREAGLTDRVPRMVAAQADGAAPIVRGLEAGAETPVTIKHPETIASGISAPFASRRAMAAVQESNGAAVGVSGKAMIDGERVLSRTEGVWPEPASAAVIPTLVELAERDEVGVEDTVVLTITGSGHKHTEPFEKTLPPVESVAQDPDAVTTHFGR